MEKTIINTKRILGFDIDDKLYIGDIKHNKVCEFHPDCIKIFKNNVPVHGFVYGLYGKWGTPTEYSLKNLNKRIIFTKRKDAKQWVEQHASRKEDTK